MLIQFNSAPKLTKESGPIMQHLRLVEIKCKNEMLQGCHTQHNHLAESYIVQIAECQQTL